MFMNLPFFFIAYYGNPCRSYLTLNARSLRNFDLWRGKFPPFLSVYSEYHATEKVPPCKEPDWFQNETDAGNQRPNSWTKSRQKSLEFSSLLFTVSSTALPWDLFFFKLTQSLMYFFKLTQPLMYFYIKLLYTAKEKGGKRGRKLHPPSLWFKKSIQKTQVWELSWLCSETQQNYTSTFMNSCFSNVL